MAATKREFSLLWMVSFFLLLVVGCTGLPDVSDLIAEDQELIESTPGVHTTAPVEIILLEPTPTAMPMNESKITPILFVSDRGTARTTDIYLVNSDGSGLTRLTKDLANDHDPSWSPDREQIAFTSDRSGVNQIYLLTLENMEVVQLTDNLAGAVSPTWSPDGARIAFVEPDPDNSTIFVMESNKEGEVTQVPVVLFGLANLAWAPKGEVIAFSALPEGGSSAERDIFSLDMSENILVNLTNSHGENDKPSWTPDGDRIAFQSDRDGDENIYVMQSDGTLQTPLTDDPAADLDPDWSSEGNLIAFSSDRRGKFDIHLMSGSGADQRALVSFSADDRQPSWSPQPAPIVDELAAAAGAHRDRRDLLVISAIGGKKIEVAMSASSDETMPDWSPDGNRIVFASTLGGNYDLYIVNADGSGEPFQLTQHSGADMHPAWSPDGSKIAFESKRDEGDWDVMIIDINGSDLRNLTANSQADDGNPSWSVNGEQIVFSSNRGDDFDIYVMDARGSDDPLQLTNLPGDEYHPDWSPDGERIAFRALSPTTGKYQLYVMDSDGGSLEPLFSSQANDDLPDWSPNGRLIAFASDRANPGSRTQAGKFDIFIYSLLTGDILQVTQGDKDVSYPDWKPSKKPANP
jgi:Tol biopolymer transport system component